MAKRKAQDKKYNRFVMDVLEIGDPVLCQNSALLK